MTPTKQIDRYELRLRLENDKNGRISSARVSKLCLKKKGFSKLFRINCFRVLYLFFKT